MIDENGPKGSMRSCGVRIGFHVGVWSIGEQFFSFRIKKGNKKK